MKAALVGLMVLCTAFIPLAASADACSSCPVRQADAHFLPTMPEDPSSRAAHFLLTPASTQLAQAAPKRRCPGGRYMGRCIQ
jgi:hypothetical protein